MWREGKGSEDAVYQPRAASHAAEDAIYQARAASHPADEVAVYQGRATSHYSEDVAQSGRANTHASEARDLHEGSRSKDNHNFSEKQIAIGAELQSLIDEMRTHDFDSIRFATYRAACKLRFIQKKTNVHKVDIWNMIEAFRENGLNAMPLHSQVKRSRLELLLTTIYHNLNKRLVASQQIDTDKSISLLLAFLLAAYDKHSTGRLTVFSIKIALATICAGKLVEKLRYIFSQISDSNGVMIADGFIDFLRQSLALPAAVFEAPSFPFSEATALQCFPKGEKITVSQFVDTFLSDPCPGCIMWLPLLHRLASVEHVYHPIQCDACQARSFTGFRYKCQRCANYQLCENCFWRGRTSQNHSNEHEMKEYSSYKSPTKQLAHSLHKSLQCIPSSSSSRPSAIFQNFDLTRMHCLSEDVRYRFSVKDKQWKVFEERGFPKVPLDLMNVVPATPNALRRLHPPEADRITPSVFLPGQLSNGISSSGLEDEHRLIARYAAKLSGRAQYPPGKGGRSLSERCLHEKEMISRLEEENNEMMREVARLDTQSKMCEKDEISLIRERKWQLEEQMHAMQQRRKELIAQLEQLIPTLNSPMACTSGSAIPDISHRLSTAFRSGSLPAATLQGDLLNAADNITNNMSSLVSELHQAQDETEMNGRRS